MLAPAAFPSFFLTLAGFILLLLVTLSVPIVKSIYLLHITASGGASVVNAGIFGLCYPGGSSSFLGIDYSTTAQCTDVHVAYDFSLLADLSDDSQRIIAKSLIGSLLLNPIAAGLAGISLFWAFFAWFCASRIMEILTFLTLFLSSLSAWIAFWLDLALVLVARSRVRDYSNGAFIGHIGNAVWLALAGAIALSLSICFAGCGVFGRYSTRYNSAPVSGPSSTRRWPWQRGVYRGTY